jgi:hypothetical protein
MTEIRIGEKGYIEEGKDEGTCILIQDDRARTGGYLIFYSKLSEFSGEVFDHWAENETLLVEMLADSRIRWLGVPLFMHPGYNRPVAVFDVVPDFRIGAKGVSEVWVRPVPPCRSRIALSRRAGGPKAAESVLRVHFQVARLHRRDLGAPCRG